MPKQLFYEDVEVGMEVPPLVKHPTSQQLVKWAGASGDYYQIHYDKDFALANGLPGIIVHGRLTASCLGQLVTDWIGSQGRLRRISCQYRTMHLPGEDLICKGTVTKKYVEGKDHCVECEIWSENPKGEKATPGSATVILPSRG